MTIRESKLTCNRFRKHLPVLGESGLTSHSPTRRHALRTSEAGCGVAQWKCRTSANDVANADFTKRLEEDSVEAESILSSNHWIPTKTLQRRNGTGANRRNERLTMVLLYRALAGTSRSPSTILATEASISDWHLSCIVAFGRATVMERIVLGFLLMHLLLLFGVLGGLLHTLFPRGCRNKSRGDREG
jgi:hypothetical protein